MRETRKERYGRTWVHGGNIRIVGGKWRNRATCTLVKEVGLTQLKKDKKLYGGPVKDHKDEEKRGRFHYREEQVGKRGKVKPCPSGRKRKAPGEESKYKLNRWGPSRIVWVHKDSTFAGGNLPSLTCMRGSKGALIKTVRYSFGRLEEKPKDILGGKWDQ